MLRLEQVSRWRLALGLLASLGAAAWALLAALLVAASKLVHVGHRAEARGGDAPGGPVDGTAVRAERGEASKDSSGSQGHASALKALTLSLASALKQGFASCAF